MIWQPEQSERGIRHIAMFDTRALSVDEGTGNGPFPLRVRDTRTGVTFEAWANTLHAARIMAARVAINVGLWRSIEGALQTAPLIDQLAWKRTLSGGMYVAPNHDVIILDIVCEYVVVVQFEDFGGMKEVSLSATFQPRDMAKFAACQLGGSTLIGRALRRLNLYEGEVAA